jgi:Flp pilus assembly protein TadG
VILRTRTSRHDGVAAVEFAFVLPVLVVILLGLWEAGRLIQLQQILSNSAREGARIAAQSQTINSTGSPTQIHVDTGTPNVKQTVVNYLRQAGLNVTAADVTVEFAFLTGDTSKTQPYQGIKGQQFSVTVRLSVQALQWSFLKVANVNQMSAKVYWTCMVDDPFTLDTSIPSW